MNEDAEAFGAPSSPLIVGLGNPGQRYADTRHNLGFRVVEAIGRQLSVRPNTLECNALIADTGNVVLALPQTYMNRSGYAVRCLAERRSLDAANFLIVYDEVSLELGRMRLRPSGGAGGHRGMESVIQNLRTDKIARLRLGIANSSSLEQQEDLSDFVLSPFDPDEQTTVDQLIARAVEACQSWLSEGTEPTMNRFNS